ncbi:Ribosomal protein L5 eukaryotic/L18 archaeal [Cynara cardunculus var. scolymus]|uniref:Ribosomal protein L5 eukaryotic/L18 archaeal n=1 Tax=Cynara cardunculus var. scolymus TaxID=59895 RepID=A0A118JVF7_CYNCS|nr:Ribosomal protein L5 eukaryotic/L18 archaeal [Cynara cardunculus var. scolymus]
MIQSSIQTLLDFSILPSLLDPSIAPRSRTGCGEENHFSVAIDSILMEDEPENYQSHFSQYIKAGVDPENIEELYKKPFVLIQPQRKLEKQPPNEHKRFNLKKLTYDERKEKLIESLNAPSAAAGGADDE